MLGAELWFSGHPHYPASLAYSSAEQAGGKLPVLEPAQGRGAGVEGTSLLSGPLITSWLPASPAGMAPLSPNELPALL